MNEENLCEVCEQLPAVTGVREVKLCKNCFDAMAKGEGSERFAKFSKLAESRAEMAEKRAVERAEHIKETERTQPPKASPLGEAVGTGAFAGAVAGLATHYLAGGKMIFPIFIVVYVLLLAHLKGWGKLVGLIVFTAVASLVVVVFQHLK
jgi:hypothetical protein